MAKYAIDGETLTDIADAIRDKNQSSDRMTPAEMAAAIAGISAGGGVPDGFSAFEVINWTPSTDILVTKTAPSINHSLGVVPDGFFISASPFTLNNDKRYVSIYSFDVSATDDTRYYSIGMSFLKNGYGTLTNTQVTDLSSYVTDQKIIPRNSNTVEHYFKKGLTYRIIVYKR